MLVVLSTTIVGGDMYVVLRVKGHWNDDPMLSIDANVVKAFQPLPLDIYDALLEDDNIFYLFDENDRVIGNHGDFTITQSEVY